MTLSIEIENMVKELRTKQEALDVLNTQRESLMDSTDLINEPGLLVSVGCPAVLQPQVSQKMSTVVVAVDPGRK